MVKVFPWNNKHFWLFFPLTTFSVSWLTPLEAVFLDALLPSVVHGLSGFLALHSEGRSLWNQCTYEHNHGNLGWACSRRNFCIQSLGKACFSKDFVSVGMAPAEMQSGFKSTAEYASTITQENLPLFVMKAAHTTCNGRGFIIQERGLCPLLSVSV